jgi:hypothetical protein
MQTLQAAVFTDPWISSDASATGRFTYRDLPDYIDLALVTKRLILKGTGSFRG